MEIRGSFLAPRSNEEEQWATTYVPSPPSRQGFGTGVVGRVAHELQGKLQFDWNPDGLACERIIPLDHRADSKGSL
jgi:hypothetical protein